MKLLFLGDVVAQPGRTAVAAHLPSLKARFGLRAVVANGENAAPNGRGIQPEGVQELLNAGVDVLTLGDHTFDQKGIEQTLAEQPKLLRPANYPAGTVGRGFGVFTVGGIRLGVINLQGRVFMRDQIDCPFQWSKRHQQEHQLGRDYDALIVDMHCEATAEKAAMAHVWDGHASLVVGTHTHIPTADTRIQPGGTALQTDAGMCGDYASSLGMSLSSVLPGYFTRGRHAFQTAPGPASLSGVVVTVAPNGLATHVERVMVPELVATKAYFG